MKNLTSAEAVDQAFQQEKAVVFKHSTRCPISGSVKSEVEDFTSRCSGIPVFIVDVIADRDVSQYVEQKSGVRHESPQAFVIGKGEIHWHGSHFSITAQDLEDQINRLS